MSKLSFDTDEQAWQGCYEEDKWVFNKLEVARRFGIICGLREELIPEQVEKVVVRPIYNLSGMSRGASIKDRWEGEATEEQCPLGFFWAEYSNEPIYSVDYSKIGEEYTSHTVLGWRENNSTNFKSWVDHGTRCHIILPNEEIEKLVAKYETVNVEYVGMGDKFFTIEIHLRPNPDLKHFKKHNAKMIIPVFAPEGEFISDPAPTSNGQRLGFIIKK